MAFEEQKQALEYIYAGLDKACRTGAFNLAEAKEQHDSVMKLSGFLNKGVHGIVSEMVQAPAELGSNPAGEAVPGTTDTIAKPR